MNSLTNCTITGTTSGSTTSDTVAMYSSEYIECHGCSGKGSIENSKGDIKKCPVCEGAGKLNKVKPCEEIKTNPKYPWYPWPVPCDPYPTYPPVTFCEITNAKR